MDIRDRRVAFPIAAHYNSVIRFFLERGMNLTYIKPPEATQRTLELGTKYSPDLVCSPFKMVLGSEIEALEAGADTLIMTMGLCRLGYYGELQEQILRDLGYDFEMINLAEYTTGNYKDYFKVVRKLNPDIKWGRFMKAVIDSLKMLEYIDGIEQKYYMDRALSADRKEYDKVYRRFLSDMDIVENRQGIEKVYRETRRAFNRIGTVEKEDPVRIGVIGEYFTVMDEFSNLGIEKMFSDMGARVHRWMNVSNRNLHYQGQKNLGVQISEYCRYEMGPTSTANIWCAKRYAEEGYDGIVHIKSAGCTPEIDIMPVLKNISDDYRIPILYLTYDSQTSDTGLQTRAEAFYDMLKMRKVVLH
jgi:predicted nucleotide-binding protein (sugar kinase/HSP70/actin superfamily)